MLGELILAAVEIKILLLHSRHVELQPLTGKQAFEEIVPMVTTNERPGCMAALKIEGSFSLVGFPTGEFIHLTIEIRRLLLEEQLDRVICELVAQQVESLGCLLDLLLLDVELAERQIAPPFGSKNLQFSLLYLDIRNLYLVNPVLQPTIPTGFGQIRDAFEFAMSATVLVMRAIVLNRPASLVPTGIWVKSVGTGEKRGHYGGDGGENGATFQVEPFPLDRRFAPERPGAVKGEPLLGAAKRTLDGEDRSGTIQKEGKAPWSGARSGPLKVAPSLAATNIKSTVPTKLSGIRSITSAIPSTTLAAARSSMETST